ncbi:Uncharacterised protein [BD1-7 clade bacterium]|uniref:DUF2169 domain-containing protein n=1 Tax=BD1-7 clade bacterium TaxID=2029982 RepID=A0A5S9PWW0_9GAMM|nr:Uncharacterised protein [BD1-7 clade bacterium]CAA0109545.1 Uncharacterised protein [BD1-7 clade bacterium]
MPHPTIDNQTPFHFEHLVLPDGNLRPQFVGILKATFRIQQQGHLVPLKEQPGLNLAGDLFDSFDGSSADDEPGLPVSAFGADNSTDAGSSGQSDVGQVANSTPSNIAFRYEPECVGLKPNTDIVVVGTGLPPGPDMPFFDCGIQVERYAKILRIFGQRQWQIDQEGEPFIQQLTTAMPTPLSYQHAFGGIDHGVMQQFGHPFDERNPIGIGYHHPDSLIREASALPLIENPKSLIQNYFDTPEPAGVGFLSPYWLERRQYAGTYDAEWEQTRSPMLPVDFNKRYFNGASSGLVANGYLQGNEAVTLVNIGQPKQTFALPGLAQPKLLLRLKKKEAALEMHLDTVVIDTDDALLSLIYRCEFELPNDSRDIAGIRVNVSNVQSQAISLV